MNVFEIEELEDVLVIEKLSSKLVVHNDEVNTFDFVIESLIEVCSHTWEQAEQCSLFIHHKGKYAVKDGDLEKLRPMKEALLERGISATIE
ncbi:MAG: ATP-dependent Clp protease adaptor ClpS [Bacteroidetes bacterium]|nr:ATP-dependent Clp protease adaptor ClpS [Bacteroidota bacterium]MBP7477557.1 ATP-dependent Clp protease adaptor ClpS [Chitinophagales bacterium]